MNNKKKLEILTEDITEKSSGLKRLFNAGKISAYLNEENSINGTYKITCNNSANFYDKFLLPFYLAFGAGITADKTGNTYSWETILPANCNMIKFSSDSFKMFALRP